MYKHTTVKKSLILLVAVLLCMSVLLAACSEKPHPTVDIPAKSTVESNGGVAVKYGDWIYYVNGYQSSVSADNTYVDTTDSPRVGSVVRIEASKIELALAEYDKDQTSTARTKAIADIVRSNAQIVVPRIYYSGNTTSPELNGIWIFNDRIYLLTPNDKLTANGAARTSEAVLMSYDLGGGSEQRHFTFTSNAAQVWLYQNGNDIMATYLMNSELHVLKVGATESASVDTLIADDEDNTTVSSVNFDVSENSLGQGVYFLDSDGSICKLAKGATAKEVLVSNATANDEESTITYTISSVSNGFVYFTKSDSDNSSVSGTVLYYTSSNDKVSEGGDLKVALNTSSVTTFGWKENKVVTIRQTTSGYYGLFLIENADGSDPICLLLPGYNEDSITIWKIDGNDLYYTAGGVTYKKNLSEFVGDNPTGKSSQLGEAYSVTTMNSASVGWALPDIVTVGEHTYVFTLSSGSVTVVEFDAVKKSNGSSVTLTLVADED